MPDNEQLLRGIAHIDEFTKQEADKAKAYIAALENEQRALHLVKLIMMARRVLFVANTDSADLFHKDVEALLNGQYAELKALIQLPELKEYTWTDYGNNSHVRVLAYNEKQAKELFEITLSQNDCNQHFTYNGCKDAKPYGLLYDEGTL